MQPLNSNDYYQFTLDSQRLARISLQNLTANADLQLLDAKGHVVASSAQARTANELIVRDLAVGTYYARVYRSSGTTNYSLQIAAQDLPPEVGGNSRGQSHNLGLLSCAPATFEDYIGYVDATDYYQCTVAGASTLTLRIDSHGSDDITAFAKVQILDGSGKLIGTMAGSDTLNNTFTAIVGAGTYYVCVQRTVAEDYFTLSLSMPALPDLGGDGFIDALDLGSINGSSVAEHHDYLGALDQVDYYKFRFDPSVSTQMLELENLSAGTQAQILDANGKVIGTYQDISASHTMSIWPDLGDGDYYLKITSHAATSAYTLYMAGEHSDGSIGQDWAGSTFDIQYKYYSWESVNILVTQTGPFVTILNNGIGYTFSTEYLGSIELHGGDKDDVITVDSSVTFNCDIYGGRGNDTLTYKGSGHSNIVSIGGGTDTLTGNGVSTAYWFDGTDHVAATDADWAGNRVHQVDAFYQPFSSDPSNQDYVPLELNSQNLRDPANTVWNGSYDHYRYTHNFMGRGPDITDVNQGAAGDCYFLAAIDALAYKQPSRLMNMITDLGDGTYAVEFTRDGVTSYVRVDEDLPQYRGGDLAFNHMGDNRVFWACIMEKAYAVYRSDFKGYAALDGGDPRDVWKDLGVASKGLLPSKHTVTEVYQDISSALAAGQGVVATVDVQIAGIPLLGDHVYVITAARRDARGNISYTFRNPWGTDGTDTMKGVHKDSNPDDGYITVTAAQVSIAVSHVAATA